MVSCYRFINNSERRQLWSIFCFLYLLMTLSWYYIEYILFNDEYYKILKQDYYSGSLYIDVPDTCTFWTLVWFRLNHYTLYGTYIFLGYILLGYEMSVGYVFMHMYIFMGLMLYCFGSPQQYYIFYYQGPILLHVLVLILNLEQEPFEDRKMSIEYDRIRRDISEENDERSMANVDAIFYCWNEAIFKMRQCNSRIEFEQVMRQMDEQIEQNLLKCQLLEYPVLIPPEPKKKNSLSICFIRVTSFLLILFTVRGIISMFQLGSSGSLNSKNTTRIM
ncbi:unnamed protein product [Rotaria socialis]|uniref:Uncharacterized protein n=2 Tax=Rotaria socialis TaxID=392032 RepID=A0A818F7Z0_9BILA|nr:unnamed protein product [Rotaria socialis]